MKCREAEEKLVHFEMRNGQVKIVLITLLSPGSLTKDFPQAGTRGEMQGSRGEAQSVREDGEGLPGFKSKVTL